MITVRMARADDDAALARIDLATWTTAVSPAPPPAASTAFFGEGTRVGDVLVAELDGALMGYVKVHQPIALESHAHVLEVGGLAVDPARHRTGAGRALMVAAIEEARRRGARKLGLRVLGPNVAARRLYEGCGFVVEGVLKSEFHLDGQDVDDVLMALELS
jgi:ribosomal protein S18 acetylase RimI-like enzyme